jgi:hypothetical protein
MFNSFVEVGYELSEANSFGRGKENHENLSK